jgi:hypothetical protein
VSVYPDPATIPVKEYIFGTGGVASNESKVTLVSLSTKAKRLYSPSKASNAIP